MKALMGFVIALASLAVGSPARAQERGLSS
jgi:hypothetical protein